MISDQQDSEFQDTRSFGVISPGTVVAHYNIVKKIGAGGMGEVYLAEDTKLNRKVALKFLLPQYTEDQEFKTRFIHEAQAAAALSHPNIITIHEVSEFENRPYFAMEYVEGQSLKELIAGKNLGAREVIDLATQIGEGLRRAHEGGIVHRDIKPQNILIDGDGCVKITDFGLAKLKGVPGVTKAGTTFGTMAYMSPEQAQGLEVDRRADIFSFGVVIYELITGNLPFRGDSEASMINAVINSVPEPLARYKAGVPDAFQRIVDKALIKERNERYQHADDLVADLRHEKKVLDFEESSRQYTPVAKQPGRRLLRYLVPAAIVAAVAVLIFIFEPFRFAMGPKEEAVAEANLVAVMYFENLADEGDPERLGEIVANLLITDLSGSQFVNVVSSQRLYDILRLLGKEDVKAVGKEVATEVATKAGAKWMLLGSILQTQPHIVLTSQVVEVESGGVVASRRIDGGEGEGIFSIVDRLTSETKADLALPAQARQEQDPSVASVTTESPEAYRHWLEGVAYARKFYLQEAEASYRKAIEIDSTFALAYYNLAMITETAERNDLVAKAVRYSEHVSDRERHYIKALEMALSGRLQQATEELERLIERYPQEKEAYHWLGAYVRTTDKQRAIVSLEKAIELDPFYKDAYNMIAYVYSGAGNFERAIWAIDKYIELAPDEANPHDSRGDIYATYGKIDQAVESYGRALEIRPDFYPSLAKLGNMYVFRGEYAEAERIYKQVSSAPERITRSTGRTLLAYIPIYRGRFGEALKVLENGLAADHMEGIAEHPMGAKHFLKAHIYDQLQQADQAVASSWEAVEIFRKIASGDPAHGRQLHAYILARAGRAAEAVSLVDSIKMDLEKLAGGRMSAYWIGKGLVELATADASGAVQSLEKVMGGRPRLSFQEAYFAGMAQLEAGNLGEAVAHLEFARSTYSENRASSPLWAARVHYLLGMAYEKSGWDTKAVEQYEELLEIWKDADPGLADIEDARRRLNGLR